MVKKKQETKKQLGSLKNRYLTLIYAGLSKRLSVKEIKKSLLAETIKQEKDGKATSKKMLKVAYSATDHLAKRTQNIEYVKKEVSAKYGVDVKAVPLTEIIGSFTYKLIEDKKVEKNLSVVITTEADKQEGDSKNLILTDELRERINQARRDILKEEDERAFDTSKLMIFYLASAHKDSASDHKDYQGKMYVDANWTSLPLYYGLKNAIAYYIKRNNVQTVQWVTGKPVRFITRPNCRHYFQNLSVKEVLATARTKLLDQYDMKTAIGDRQYLQTIKHSTDKEWYDDVRNAQLLLASYKERLSLHQSMYKANPCSLLKKAIDKDRMLIKKWEAYINEKGG